MLSINTNISSLIAQQSMSSATNKLNQAIERMTTGYKINGAKDNAANYSISQNMQTQLGSYDVAADNVAMGMDLVTTASDIISNMQDKASRLQALCTQARNGTYGQQSLAAINTEAGAIMSEIMRLYSTAEYNQVSLFNREAYQIDESLPQAKAEYNGFVEDPKNYTDAYVDNLVSVQEAINSVGLQEGEKYKINSKEDLIALADFTNEGNYVMDMTFIMGNDIDLEGVDWVPIGNMNTGACFASTFDGNGHVISNLTIDNSTADCQALFGYTDNAIIRNVALLDVNIKGKEYVGALIGLNESGGDISNIYATGSISGISGVGGIIGAGMFAIANSYVTCSVRGQAQVGGLAGEAGFSTITNSYATSSVTGTSSVGGLVGHSSSGTITNSYAIGNVSGNTFVGGLLGQVSNTSGTRTLDGNASYGRVSGVDLTSTGSLIGGVVNTTNGTSFGTVNITNSQSVAQDGINSIGGCFKSDGTAISYDMTTMLAGISAVEFKNIMTTLQVGIKSDSSCQITFDTNFKFDLSAIEGNIASDEALAAINDFTNLLSEKSTQLGAVQNRLDSAIESITVNMENLTSSLSTIRDADIAEVSSEYIRQQILQQASATLLATANQSPSIALQLI